MGFYISCIYVVGSGQWGQLMLTASCLLCLLSPATLNPHYWYWKDGSCGVKRQRRCSTVGCKQRRDVKKSEHQAFRGLRWAKKTLVRHIKANVTADSVQIYWEQCVWCVLWHECVWFCLLLAVVCSTLMGTLHTATLHAVNRSHAECVDKTKISSDCDAIKAESLSWWRLW